MIKPSTRQTGVFYSLLLIILISTGGCTADFWRLPEFTSSPAVNLTGVESATVGPDGLRLVLAVEVENPNNHDLPLTNASYTIQFADLTHAGQVSPNTTLPANRPMTIYLPAAFPGTYEPGSAFSGSVSGSLEYHPTGNFRLLLNELNIPLPTTSFRGEFSSSAE